MAVPRRKKGEVKIGDGFGLGQENVDTDVDFGEADFLDYALVDDMEMGGA